MMYNEIKGGLNAVQFFNFIQQPMLFLMQI